jgi:outer membrane receptor for ferric coprogen and ferric-rhodotorulic acid
MNKPATPPTRGLAGGLSGRKLLASSALLATPLAILAQTAPTTTETPSSAAAADDEVVVLSPFEVVGETRGYQATNTMSGTRFNTKLEDLASSITVMTKNQMSDFAMIDLNDVFLYVAGTEGSGTYTDVTIDRNGSVSDNVQLNPTQANRVRGLAAANVALDNIETMGRVPVDPITVDALEVSRGANANVFGLGNPSGTVNQVSASANLSRDKMTTEARADSYGGWRTSLDVNQVLLKDKLAIRGSAVFQQEEFTRKPSGVKTERYNGMIKYKPFKYTTIAGSVFYYHAYGNRPNTLPPRDNISYWLSQGSLTWDP